ncbi:MAG: rRNA pseudouridine synthase, partial [Dehalococcoidia bacterium]|nr:rRNA pseudouridine synthase [Dehalococcoidia bacterium]
PLLKALTAAGLGARRTVAQAVKDGRVWLNGQPATSFNQAVTPKDNITFDGKPLRLLAEKPVYLLLNKPAGVLSVTCDARGRQTIIDLVPIKYRVPGLHPVGRLDLASRGLTLLTSDGRLTYRLSHPRFEKEKEYLAELDRVLTPADEAVFARGLELEDGPTCPAGIAGVSLRPPIYRITLHEGRKRQIRRMFQSLGYVVRDLKRTRLGSLRLGALKEGEVRELTDDELRSLDKGE